MIYVYLILTLILSSCGDSKRYDSHTPLIPEEHLELIESGDILFRRGRSMASQAVLSADAQGNYSHIGMAVEIDGEVVATHAVPGECEEELVKFEPLDGFFSYRRAKHGATLRYPLDSVAKREIERVAKEIVASRIPFDHEYNDQCGEHLYCTEYVWLLFNAVGIDITRAQRAKPDLFIFKEPVILPSHIYSHPSLTLISSF